MIFLKRIVTKQTCDIGYRVIDKSTGNLITTGKDLGFLGKNIARLDNLIITKNVIFTNNEPAVYNDKSGYVMIFFKKNSDEKDYKFILYDNEGKCVEINYDYRTICKIASKAPDVIMPELIKDGKLFEQMIIACLKDKKELIDCEADNLFDLVKYLEEHGLELALDLTFLKVYKVNYKKYFNRIKAKENSQDVPKLVRKLDASSSKNK